MSVEKNRDQARRRRHKRLRQKVVGTSDRPRLCVTKTLNHMYAQVIDDYEGDTVASASTLEADVIDGRNGTATVAAARAVGKAIGERARARGIEAVVFDRAGWPYHGRVAAVCEGAREAGLDV